MDGGEELVINHGAVPDKAAVGEDAVAADNGEKLSEKTQKHDSEVIDAKNVQNSNEGIEAKNGQKQDDTLTDAENEEIADADNLPEYYDYPLPTAEVSEMTPPEPPQIENDVKPTN